MPSLVEKTGEGKRGGIWEVKWTWMPAFLAMDTSLVTAVDQHLNELFAGEEPPDQEVLEQAVVDLVCEKYTMDGLKEVLVAIRKVDPTERKLRLVGPERSPQSSEEPTKGDAA